MTNNDMGPAFGFMLIGMMILLLLSSVTVNSNSFLISRALKLLDESFSESIGQNEDLSESSQNPEKDETYISESGPSEELPW